MANTEKPSTKAEQKKAGNIKVPTQKIAAPIPKSKVDIKKSESKKIEPTKEKKKAVPVKKIKRNFATINVSNLPISTKYSMAICKFIKGKKIKQAIAELELVCIKKKAVPMKGEIPHRKGKIMSGRFPKNASERFIILLNSLIANANENQMNNPIIKEAVSNIGERPFGRFGRWRKKRTHVYLKATEKIKFKKNKKGAKK